MQLTRFPPARSVYPVFDARREGILFTKVFVFFTLCVELNELNSPVEFLVASNNVGYSVIAYDINLAISLAEPYEPETEVLSSRPVGFIK